MLLPGEQVQRALLHPPAGRAVAGLPGGRHRTADSACAPASRSHSMCFLANAISRKNKWAKFYRKGAEFEMNSLSCLGSVSIFFLSDELPQEEQNFELVYACSSLP